MQDKITWERGEAFEDHGSGWCDYEMTGTDENGVEYIGDWQGHQSDDVRDSDIENIEITH